VDMSASDYPVVPLDDCHELFSAFGINPYSRAYQRWRRDDGFRLPDLRDVLDESGLTFIVDWRAWLRDAVNEMIQQLALLEITATAELDEDGNQGMFSVYGRSTNIKYIPAEEHSFDDVVAVVNHLIAPSAQYKKFRACEGSDHWSYALLRDTDWQALHSAIPKTMELLFKEVCLT
jgi:hypothetical protein